MKPIIKVTITTNESKKLYYQLIENISPTLFENDQLDYDKYKSTWIYWYDSWKKLPIKTIEVEELDDYDIDYYLDRKDKIHDEINVKFATIKDYQDEIQKLNKDLIEINNKIFSIIKEKNND